MSFPPQKAESLDAHPAGQAMVRIFRFCGALSSFETKRTGATIGVTP